MPRLRAIVKGVPDGRQEQSKLQLGVQDFPNRRTGM